MEHLATCEYNERTDLITNVIPCEDAAGELEAIYNEPAYEMRAGLKGWAPYTSLITSTDDHGFVRYYLYGEDDEA